MESCCPYCKTISSTTEDSGSLDVRCDSEVMSKCSTWLERCTLSSEGDSMTSCCTSDTADSIFSEDLPGEEDKGEDADYGDQVVCVESKENKSGLTGLFGTSNQYGEVNMKRCRKVHLGNVTKIYGPVHITQATSVVNKQSVTNKIFLEGAAEPVRPKKLSIVDRRSWLAQPPVEDKQYLQAPARFVIISHTASEEGFTQAENVYLVRLIQTFHIESRRWSDIAYNFLVGSDGNVYEGRGWNVVGAHTFGYNDKSVGISFVGCFINKLPQQAAMEQAKILIGHGVEIGAIDENYVLIGHCQCTPTESPGRRLFEEIQTWEHWGGRESVLEDRNK